MSSSSSTSALELLTSLTWKCLNTQSFQNPLFLELFSSETVLSDFLTAADLSFHDGLVDMIQASTPPSLRRLKSPEATDTKCWGIYIIVMEKKGAVPLIYCGSGTSAKGGIRVRFRNYDIKTLLPKSTFQVYIDYMLCFILSLPVHLSV
jgi:hypothetical protein